MQMNNLFAPITLFFLIVVIGYLLGKIQICGISLDLSAILLIAVFAGYLISAFYPTAIDDGFHNAMSLFSNMGTALFVSAIGISSGCSIIAGSGNRQVVSFLLGALMVCFGFLAAKIIASVDVAMDTSILLGILCGALTSTPGLASACETENVISESATVGYGAAYLIGVIGAVVFVQCFMAKGQRARSIDDAAVSSKSAGLQSFIAICVTSLLGRLISGIKIPYIRFSFGNTGSILLCGIVIGCIMRKITKQGSLPDQSMDVYRNFGLILFFVGNGVTAGQRFTAPLHGKWFVYSFIITAASILGGYIVCRFVMKKNTENQMCIVAGGMTSTPAMGVLLKKAEKSPDISVYSFAYLGALLTMTLGIRVFCAFM